MNFGRTRGRHDFHESYYEHSCAIIDEKDVLVTDIPGRTYTARLKRWWHGLFLLSYSDGRNRIFYTSSQAMRIERTRQYRKFKGRIHPLSQFRNFWDILMLILLMANKIIFNHNTSLVYGQICYSFYIVGPIIEVIIIIDIYLNLKTGYVNHEARKVILEEYDGLLHYSSTKLFMHVASAIPLQWIMYLRYGANVDCALCKTNKFISALKVLNFIMLFRLYEYSSYWTRERKSYKLTFVFKLLRIFVLGFFTMLQFLDLADNFTLQLMIAGGKIEQTSYISTWIWIRFVYEYKYSDCRLLIFNFSRICKAILLFGFSYKRTKFYLDIMTSLGAFLIANMFNIWVILECYNYIYCMRFNEDQVIGIKSATGNLVRRRQLPDRITKKLWKYFDFHQSKMRSIETHNCLYKSLPDVLKKEILLATNSRFIKRIPYFSEWPQHLHDEIVLMLKEDIYLNGDIVAEPWVQSEGLTMVAMGELAVYSKDEETGHLIDGDYFGELSLVTNKELRSSSVVAITTSVILLLEKRDFRRFMRDYPDLFYALKQELKDKHGLAATKMQEGDNSYKES